MNNQHEIEKLTHALELAQDCFEHQEAIIALTDSADEKHTKMIRDGFSQYNKTLIMHGIMGALSHFESELNKEENEKRIATIRDTA